ncbi:MAG: GlsB/YeaQ/YmgE family stress response membrane protein [Candidatus Izemoplasma sp.]|nr:GlsB/YeaQ/YmgE family stress response membrane protein [Candidatus Izemoplasma sp.]
MYILLWIIFGAFVGWIASIITGSNKRMGLLANIVVGLLGAFIGGWIASLFGIGSFSNFSLNGMLIAIGGAVLLLWVLNAFKK